MSRDFAARLIYSSAMGFRDIQPPPETEEERERRQHLWHRLVKMSQPR